MDGQVSSPVSLPGPEVGDEASIKVEVSILLGVIGVECNVSIERH